VPATPTTPSKEIISFPDRAFPFVFSSGKRNFTFDLIVQRYSWKFLSVKTAVDKENGSACKFPSCASQLFEKTKTKIK
jgi:hypothetical protein